MNNWKDVLEDGWEVKVQGRLACMTLGRGSWQSLSREEWVDSGTSAHKMIPNALGTNNITEDKNYKKGEKSKHRTILTRALRS